MDENSKGDAPSQTEVQPDKPVVSEAVNQPVTSAPAPDDTPPDAPKSDPEPVENDSTAATWWGSWSNSNWAKTITDASTKITKSVSHGLELANQALDKEIEIEIDVDKVVSATKTIANKTIEHSKTIIEKSGDVYDQSIKLVDEGVKTVTKDVAELSEAIVEDSKATYSAFSEVTYTTIEQVGGSDTAKTATAVKESVFGAVNALASVILADTSDEEENTNSRTKAVLGPEARLHQLRISPATYCNEAEDMVAYLQWLETFDMEGGDIKADISEVMVECPEVRALYSKLVPDAVSHADFWQRYYYRLANHTKAEMRRSQLVEKCDTEEDEALDSWGDDDSDDETPPLKSEEVEKSENLEKPENDLKNLDSSQKHDKNAKTENPVESEKKVQKLESDDQKEISIKSENDEISEKPADEIAEPELKKIISSEEEKSEKSVENVPKESDRQTTPQSQESKDSEWTAVDKSESDDWEQEFDIEMTEEEIKKALESVDKNEEGEEKGEGEEDWDDWS